ncbi:hypothetical protein C8R44DRAFT_854633 [Mycena epipterygia]|nr:hypothetical protein C8R44DRAFT_854633 [Mycena epipterygia]
MAWRMVSVTISFCPIAIDFLSKICAQFWHAFKISAIKTSLTSTTMPDLPQELIDAIIEDVPDASLPACALTATAFVIPSQRRLFRWLSLAHPTQYSRAAALLTSSRHLTPYVHALALDVKEIPPDCADLKSILAQLTELERLSIAGDLHSHTPFAQNPCLLDVFRLPSLKCRSPTSPLPADYAPIPPPVPPPQNLWHLRVVGDPYDTVVPFVLEPQRAGYLNKLTRLTLTFAPLSDEFLPKFMALLSSCSGTLKHLDMELAAPLDLPPLPALTSLELSIDIDTVHDPALFASIVSGTTKSMPHLAVLTLAISDRPPHHHRHHWAAPDGVAWPQLWHDLDAALLALPALRHAVFALRYFTPEPERYAAFVPHIAGKLPRALSAGFLRFSTGVSVVRAHPMDGFADE